MADIKAFPGVEIPKGDEIPSCESIWEQVKERNPRHMICISMLENDVIMVSGNTSKALGVYLMEMGKMVLLMEE